MPDISVANIEPDQVSYVRKLYKELVHELYALPEARQAFLKHWTEKDLSEACGKTDKAILIASTPELPVAGLFFGGVPEGGVGTVIWFGVDQRCRGRSVGHVLLDSIEQFYSGLGAHKIKLFCNTSEARQFYEKSGYTVEGFHPGHWWQIDCWSMGKAIPMVNGDIIRPDNDQ